MGLSGYTRVELVGQDILRLEIWVNPEDRHKMTETLEEQGRIQDVETRFRKKSGEVRDVLVSAELIEVAGQQYILGLMNDITESKNLKAQLDQVGKMEAIGTLAGGIAHDFNNILAPIIGYSELSLESVPKDGKLSHNMRQVLVSANRAKDLVKQILTFSRKTTQEKRPVQVGLLVKEALKLLRSTLPSTIEIRQLLHPDAMESATMADPTRIHRVLMNLCTNAAHAMRARAERWPSPWRMWISANARK